MTTAEEPPFEYPFPVEGSLAESMLAFSLEMKLFRRFLDVSPEMRGLFGVLNEWMMARVYFARTHADAPENLVMVREYLEVSGDQLEKREQ